MRVKENVYISPEKEGLEIIASADAIGNKTSETFILFKNKDGLIYWGFDSTNLKNTPFENVKELNEINCNSIYNTNLAISNTNLCKCKKEDLIKRVKQIAYVK